MAGEGAPSPATRVLRLLRLQNSYRLVNNSCARTPHQLAPGSRTCELFRSAVPPPPSQPGSACKAGSSPVKTRRKNLEGLTSTSDLEGEKASAVKGLAGPVTRRRNPRERIVGSME